MRKLTLFVAILCFARFAVAATVWLDTDVSIGSPIREVDDAYALVLAFHSPEIRIVGISTTYGNAPLGHTTRMAQELVREFGATASVKPDQVFAGARSADDLGRRSEASEALAKALEKDSVTYVALGPLTNLATFLQLHPRMGRRIERVIFVGGQARGTTLAFGPNRSFHIHDANVFKDPRAAALVLQTKIPLTLTPVATSSNLVLVESDLRELERQGGAARYLARRSKVWLWFWTHFAGTNGGPIFDALALVAATRPELLSLEKRQAEMDDSRNLVVSTRASHATRPVSFCGRFTTRTKRLVMERLVRRSARDN
ncbi:MAG TPA: nucleoside hydrolase [Chthoniobacterales bacterium]